ncbi:helix-turn-helix transcriptional regulator [Hathewaya massiliensis]|uniref:helix-turn-helix transcriptional regulator n=1 Tax=Hathewaya massiliensis TaxID=1964382 RepID=UPI00115AABA6|nr:helix-turn-helix domain-containing protein [Hathewaya massiliensis]
MDKEGFIKKIDSKLKLIRNEKEYSQDKMCEIIGMSKKTLVQIEKGRATLGWSGAVVVCSLFKHSEILQMTLGGDIEDIVRTLAFGEVEGNYNKTMGGKVWWRNIRESGEYVLQQNIVSGHYRILDGEHRRIISSFDEKYMELKLNILSGLKLK